MPLNIFVKLIQFIAKVRQGDGLTMAVHVISSSPSPLSSISSSSSLSSTSSLKERMEHAMSEIVLDLLNPGRSKTNINPEVSLLNTWTVAAATVGDVPELLYEKDEHTHVLFTSPLPAYDNWSASISADSRQSGEGRGGPAHANECRPPPIWGNPSCEDQVSFHNTR